MYRYLLLVIFSCYWLMSCHTPAKTLGSPVESAPFTKSFQAEDYLNSFIRYQTFTSKANINIRTANDNQNLSANIKMHKDKDIWSSVLALGGLMEVARGYITTDSLKAIVRIGKKAYQLSYEEGLQLLEADIEFSALQNLIVGNPLIEGGKIVKSYEDSTLYNIDIQKGDYYQTLSYDKSTHLLQSLLLKAPKKNFECLVNYKNYKPLAMKEAFAHSQSIQILNKGEAISIEMNFSNVQLNTPLEVQFSIPSSYTIVRP